MDVGIIILLQLLLDDSEVFLNGKFPGSKCGEHILRDFIPALLSLFIFENEKGLTIRNVQS